MDNLLRRWLRIELLDVRTLSLRLLKMLPERLPVLVNPLQIEDCLGVCR